MSDEFFKKTGLSLSVASCKVSGIHGKVTEMIGVVDDCPIEVHGIKVEMPVFVLKGSSQDFVLGGTSCLSILDQQG